MPTDTSEKSSSPVVGREGLRKLGSDKGGDVGAVWLLPVDLGKLSTLALLELSVAITREMERRIK